MNRRTPKLMKNDPFNQAFQPLLVSESDIAVGDVLNVNDFGVYIRLHDGTTGLLHCTEMTSPLSSIRIGKQIRVQVCSIDLERKRISFSQKIENTEYAEYS